MPRHYLSAALACLFSMPIVGVADEVARRVEVTNLPEIQRIRGKVAIEGLPASSSFIVREGKAVPPVGRTESPHLIDLGTLEVEGFQRMTLSLHVESQGRVTKAGKVGILLLPDREPIRQSLRLEDQILLACELGVELPIGSIPVAAQESFDVAFPRYRLLLYNESNASARVDTYLYLTR